MLRGVISEPRSRHLHLIWIIAIAALLRIIPALNSPNWTDLYLQQAYPVLRHLNVYKAAHNIFPYSPVSMFFPALCVVLSSFLKIPFHIFMRIPPILADIAINAALYSILLKRGQKTAILGGLFYAVNPISILISSFHGNIIMIAVLFSFLAYVVLLEGVQENYRLSALLLGLAVGFRGYPVLLLPFFILLPELTKAKKIRYALYALAPTLISFIPFLLADAKSLIMEVFCYGGFPDHGFLAVMRAVYSLKTSVLQYSLPQGPQLMAAGKYIFIAAYLVMVFAYRRKRLIISISSVFLAFYLFYPGISSQYLAWILPFAFLMDDRYLDYFMIFGTMGLLSFYVLYHPYIILGRWADIALFSRFLVLIEIIFLLAFWLLCALWGLSLFYGGKRRGLEGLI